MGHRLVAALLLTALGAAWAQSPPPGLEAARKKGKRGHFVGVIDCKLAVLRTKSPIVYDYPAIVQIAVDFGSAKDAKQECFTNMHVRRGMLSASGWDCPNREFKHCIDDPGAVWTVEQSQKHTPMGKTYLAWKDLDGRSAAMIWEKPADAKAMCESQHDALVRNPRYAKSGATCVNPVTR